MDAAIEFLKQFSGLSSIYEKNKREQKESDDKKRN